MTVQDVWIVAKRPSDIETYFCTVIGSDAAAKTTGRIEFQTPRGKIVLAAPQAFGTAFGLPSLHIEDGLHLAGLTIGCRTLGPISERGLKMVGTRYMLPPRRGFGTAIRFLEIAEG